MRRRGAIAAALLLAAQAAFALAGCGEERPPEAPPTPEPAEEAGGAGGRKVFRTAAECGACHREIYEEWKASMHGQAMSDPLFLDLAKQAASKEECIRCHAPVPLREVDFDTPIARAERREDAISCLSCHQAGENVAGPIGGLQGACRPVYDPDQRNVVKMCFGCHNQHDTGTEWLDGPYGPRAPEPRRREARTCLDCHMPEVERPLVPGGPVRKGRRHTWPGGHDITHVRKAAEVDAEVTPLAEGGFRFRAWVTNVGAGHDIPTDARHRSFDVYFKLWDAGGNVILDPLDLNQQARAHAATYRQWYRNEGKRDTQIPPLARVSAIEDEEGYVDVPGAVAGRGEVWLVYRLTPGDMLEEESVTDAETFVPYRARLVTKKAFEYGR